MPLNCASSFKGCMSASQWHIWCRQNIKRLPKVARRQKHPSVFPLESPLGLLRPQRRNAGVFFCKLPVLPLIGHVVFMTGCSASLVDARHHDTYVGGQVHTTQHRPIASQQQQSSLFLLMIKNTSRYPSSQESLDVGNWWMAADSTVTMFLSSIEIILQPTCMLVSEISHIISLRLESHYSSWWSWN